MWAVAIWAVKTCESGGNGQQCCHKRPASWHGGVGKQDRTAQRVLGLTLLKFMAQSGCWPWPKVWLVRGLRCTAASRLQREQPIGLSEICPACSQNISKTSGKAGFVMCVSSPFSFAPAFSDIVAEVEPSIEF